MATLYIAEFSAGALTATGATPAPSCPPITQQVVSISGSSTQSSAFNAATRLIRVHTDTACFVNIGSDPTSSISTMKMVAGQTEYFGVGAGMKIAVTT